MSQFISGLNVSPYGCSVCGKCYKYQHSLYRHIKYECGKPPNFACPYPRCNYKSKRKDNLAAHVRGHNKSKEY